MLGTYFASGSGNVYCPVVDDNPSATFSASTSLNVDVYDGTSSASLTAQACVTFAGSLGSSCGSAAPSGGAFTGHTTLSPSLSSWTGYPNDYAFALVVVPANGTGVNYVKGYWQAF